MTIDLNRRSAIGAAVLLAGTAGTARGQSRPTERPLAGKVAIVTGARRNQGRAYAVALARAGAHLVLHFHSANSATDNRETERLVAAEGAKFASMEGDLSLPARAAALFDAAEKSFGGIDILVNTVGLIIKKPVAEVTEDDYERSQRANAKSALLLMQQAARRMRDNGRIIHIGTSLTAGTAPGYALYAGTKAPAEEFTRMLAREIGRRGITVNNVAPGPLDNSFFHGQETPQSAAGAATLSVAGRLGRESDIVPVVEFLASAGSQWVTGQVLWVNGGYLTR